MNQFEVEIKWSSVGGLYLLLHYWIWSLKTQRSREALA